MKTENTKRYSSVLEMLRGIGMDSDFVESFEAQVKAEAWSSGPNSEPGISPSPERDVGRGSSQDNLPKARG